MREQAELTKDLEKPQPSKGKKRKNSTKKFYGVKILSKQ